MLVLAEEGVILSSLRNAGKIDLGDWFQFEIENNEVQPHQGFGGLRFPIRAFLDGRTFESFHIDVGVGDPVIESAEELVIPPLIAFAEFPPTRILCYPITQQIAEKVHAFTRQHDSGESSRVKDFVDILLLATLSDIDAEKLRHAIDATFSTRKTHSIPKSIPNPPFEWSKPFQKIAREVSLSYRSIDDATEAFKQFFEPILSDMEIHQWDPSHWLWK